MRSRKQPSRIRVFIAFATIVSTTFTCAMPAPAALAAANPPSVTVAAQTSTLSAQHSAALQSQLALMFTAALADDDMGSKVILKLIDSYVGIIKTMIDSVPTGSETRREAYFKAIKIYFCLVGLTLVGIPIATTALGAGIGLCFEGVGALPGMLIGLGCGFAIDVFVAIPLVLAGIGAIIYTIEKVAFLEEGYTRRLACAAPQDAVAGPNESFCLNFIDLTFSDKVIQFAQNWDRMPGLTAEQQSFLRNHEPLHVLFNKAAYVKQHKRFSPTSPVAAPLSGILLVANKVVTAANGALEQEWLKAQGLAGLRPSVRGGSFVLSVPNSLQAAGAPSEVSVPLPNGEVKVDTPATAAHRADSRDVPCTHLVSQHPNDTASIPCAHIKECTHTRTAFGKTVRIHPNDGLQHASDSKSVACVHKVKQHPADKISSPCTHLVRITAKFQPGTFNIHLGQPEVVRSGEGANSVRVSYSINAGTGIGKITVGGGAAGVAEVNQTIDATLPSAVGGVVYLKHDGGAVRLDQVSVNGASVPLPFPNIPAALNQAAEPARNRVAAGVRSMLAGLPWKEALAKLNDAPGKSLAKHLAASARSYGLLGVDGLRDCSIVNGRLQADVAARMLPVPPEAEIQEFLRRFNEVRKNSPADGGTPPVLGNVPILLAARDAAIRGSNAKLDGGVIGWWNDPQDYVSWSPVVPKGKYQVEISYACPDNYAGSDYSVGLEGGARLNAKTVGTGGWQSYRSLTLGEIEAPGGRITLTARALKIAHPYLMNLQQIRLVPAGALQVAPIRPNLPFRPKGKG